MPTKVPPRGSPSGPIDGLATVILNCFGVMIFAERNQNHAATNPKIAAATNKHMIIYIIYQTPFDTDCTMTSPRYYIDQTTGLQIKN